METGARPTAHCLRCHLLSLDQLSEKAPKRPRVQRWLPHKTRDWEAASLLQACVQQGKNASHAKGQRAEHEHLCLRPFPLLLAPEPSESHVAEEVPGEFL